MKVLLIDTGYDAYEIDEPLGIEQLDACIRNEFKNRIELTTIWMIAEPYFKLQDFYDVVLISANIYDGGKMEEIIRYYSKASKKPQIIVGGVAPTLSSKRILSLFSNVICIVGEGEDSIIKLLQLYINNNDIFNSSDIYKIPNLTFVDKNKGLIQTNRSVMALSEIKYLPNRKYLNYTIKNNGLIRIESSRGCDWNQCSFCMVPWKYANHQRREFSIDRLSSDIENLIYHNINKIYFTDEEFFSNDIKQVKKKIELLKKFKKIKPDIQYIASTSVRLIIKLKESDENFWLVAKQAGISKLFVGIESFSDSQLKRFCKGNTSDDNIKALNILHASGIETDIGFIMFDPYVTIDELEENVDKIIESNFITTTARINKKLRVINNTKFYSKLHNTEILKDFDKLGMDYKWDFADPKIDSLYEKFARKEEKNIQKMYFLQSNLRSMNDDNYTNELKSLRKELIIDFKKLILKEKQ